MRLPELTPATDEHVAAELVALQRAAYAVEAALIGDDRIPPLHEEPAQLRALPLRWLGVRREGRLAGAIAYADDGELVDVHRLVVDPAAHRQGIGAALVRAVLTRAGGRPVTVSTGRDNTPARALYSRLGFQVSGEEEVLPGLRVTHLRRPGDAAESCFLALVLANPTVAAVLDRAPRLGAGDWWLTAGVLFQSVWNGLTGRDAQAGIRDADFFYFDPDTSWDAEDAVIRRGAQLFADLAVPVEIRNEARVHLWYADHFGVPAAPFRDCRDAIDHFAAVCCCHGVRVTGDGELEVYAPHGYADLFGLVVRPNRRLAPRAVYEAKATRWLAQWPELTVLPWEENGPARS